MKKIKFVSIPVRDQDRALAFWTEQMGLQVTTDQPMGPGQRTGMALFTPDGHESRIGAFSGISFESEDVEAEYRELTSRGVEFPQPPKKESWGTSAVFKDSEGNLFVLSSR
jgi:predicted enzyme related to lactoylglutathione lyase